MLMTPCMCACRETDRDMVIKGYRVPKGLALMLSPHPMHVSSLNYLHPDKFWPERWVSDIISEWDPDEAGRWALDCCYCCCFSIISVYVMLMSRIMQQHCCCCCCCRHCVTLLLLLLVYLMLLDAMLSCLTEAVTVASG